MNATCIEEILRLSVDDRIRLVQRIWDSIAADGEPQPLSVQQPDEIERRIAAHRNDPSRAIPWKDAVARLRERYG
jgi:putative addiction module component (TIGR02574 family)